MRRGGTVPAASSASPISFHRLLPGYEPSELRVASCLAEMLGVSEVWVKEESNRFGLPAYKALGASWAVYRAALQRVGLSEGQSLDELRVALRGTGLALVAATDGNHGRAVARAAGWLDLES